MKTNYYTILCSTCGTIQPDTAWWTSNCCDTATCVRYEYPSKAQQFPFQGRYENSAIGNTPLIYLENLSAIYGCCIWAKCEQQNPTGSFKDRGSVLECQKAKDDGYRGIVCASTGNMAVSLSAQATRQGLRCIDVIPKRTTNRNIELMRSFGGETIEIDGSYDDCVLEAQQIANKRSKFLCGDYTLRREGQKTIGWELAKSNVKLDILVLPVGNGNLATAIYQGYQESRTPLPKLIGVQPSRCNPITTAYRSASPICPQYPKKRTVARAFDVGSPIDGPNILKLVTDTDGFMTDAADEEMVSGIDRLSRMEGIASEVVVGASLAAIQNNTNLIRGKTVGIILTGSGLKEGGE